jgi:hypothetical protein
VDYEGYTEEKLTIKGDRMSEAEFKLFLGAAFAAALATGCAVSVCSVIDVILFSPLAVITAITSIPRVGLKRKVIV